MAAPDFQAAEAPRALKLPVHSSDWKEDPFDYDPKYERPSFHGVYCVVYDPYTMRTNIDLDEDLVQAAQRLSGIETKKGVVHEALRFYVESKGRKSLLDLRGKIQFAPGYDHKALREDRDADGDAA